MSLFDFGQANIYIAKTKQQQQKNIRRRVDCTFAKI